MGTPPKDVDIVTLGDPKKLAEDIAANIRGRIIELGKPGMKVFRIVTREQTVDIAPANGKSIEEDLNKRDFTINAMAISLDNKNDSRKIIDPHNGIDDLNNKIIRMISSGNLRTDPIRLLRAYRIASLLNFTIDRKTSRAIKSASSLIYTSAGERIKDELLKLFNTPRSHHYLLMMNDTGLLTAVFPELSPLKGCSQNSYHQYDAFDHTLKAYGFLEKLLHRPDSLTPEIVNLKTFLPAAKQYAMLKYTILLHDIGKPSARTIDPKGQIHFYSHEKMSADMALKINRRLRLSNQEQNYMDFIVRNHLRPLSLFTAYKQNRLSKRTISRFFLKCEQMTKDLLIHTVADLYGKGINENTRAFIEFLNHMIKLYIDSFLPKKSNPPLINGDDLINEFGLKPSPLFSKILQHVEEERISDNIATRNEAFILVKNFLNPA
ncbi:MAG: CCA tRNA nucleotidyltransferase [Desulfobacteraceae bacterium]|nr:CCA tRNA nucleotidyltransferase [Desulfobacteraceae bacterium]MBC2754549.1 CCA tRNA nucleotidyltransferase [Desulfobacteraceae bacterium]